MTGKLSMRKIESRDVHPGANHLRENLWRL